MKVKGLTVLCRVSAGLFLFFNSLFSRRFLSDYDKLFPVADDISLLQQALPVMYPRPSHAFVCTSEEVVDKRVQLRLSSSSLNVSPSDETRTSYLLQGVENAWDSVGRHKPHMQRGSSTASSSLTPADQGAAGGAAAPVSEDVPGGVGAEAALEVPRKGDNVSRLVR